MGRTLGINDDYWHAIIPFIIMLIGVPAGFWAGFSKTWLLVLWLGLGLLQFFNELKQAMDPHLKGKYGSLEGFQQNSKRDTKLFLVGSFLGFFFGLLIQGFVS